MASEPDDRTARGGLDGRLLIATPSLVDPNFHRTVVLLLHHDDEGTVGVVVNRPSDVAVGGPLDPWSGAVSEPRTVFAGGPVEPNAVIGLARVVPAPDEGWQPIAGDLGVVDLERDPAAYGPLDARIFAGYAGWAAGQLEAEFATGSWFLFDARPDDPFSVDPDGLWERSIRRQGGLYRTFAPEPTAN